MTRARTEAIEREASPRSTPAIGVDNVTVGAVSHRRRELDTVSALIDAPGLTGALLEAALALTGAGAWI